MTALEVVAPGPLTLVQDLGRGGREHWGVPPSGAFDRAAHDLAQRLVGNHPTAAGLEVLLGAFAAVAHGDVVVAVTGARCAVTVGGRVQGRDVALPVRAGELIELGPVLGGLRVAVGVRGGLAVAPVLGSRARDVGGGIGPAPVAAGDVLPVGSRVAGGPCWEQVPVRARGAVLPVVPGPHDDALDTAGWRALETAPWTVDARSDRMGVRLSSPAALGGPGDVASFPVVPGSVQLTPSGGLVVLGPDAGVTGGYPVLGVVPRAGLDVLAQARPGSTVRLRRPPR